MDNPGFTISTLNLTPPPPSYYESCESPSYISCVEVRRTATPPPSYLEAVSSPLSPPGSPYPIFSAFTDIRTGPHPSPVGFPQSPINTAVSSFPVFTDLPDDGTGPPTSPVRVQPSQAVSLGDAPTEIVCPHCRNNIITKVYYKPGSVALGMCCLLAVFGLFCGFCLIPCCLPSFQDVYHTCPDCRKSIGMYTRWRSHNIHTITIWKLMISSCPHYSV